MEDMTPKDPYLAEQENNNAKVQQMMEIMFPDIGVPFDYIYQTMSFLQETQVNAEVLPRVIRGVNNLILGTGEGEVVIHVRGNVLTVETKEREGSIKVKNI